MENLLRLHPGHKPDQLVEVPAVQDNLAATQISAKRDLVDARKYFFLNSNFRVSRFKLVDL